ncbi:MAG: hypothetical protein U0324_27270 [Polyangiales bacterium]
MPGHEQLACPKRQDDARREAEDRRRREEETRRREREKENQKAKADQERRQREGKESQQRAEAQRRERRDRDEREREERRKERRHQEQMAALREVRDGQRAPDGGETSNASGERTSRAHPSPKARRPQAGVPHAATRGARGDTDEDAASEFATDGWDLEEVTREAAALNDEPGEIARGAQASIFGTHAPPSETDVSWGKVAALLFFVTVPLLVLLSVLRVVGVIEFFPWESNPSTIDTATTPSSPAPPAIDAATAPPPPAPPASRSSRPSRRGDPHPVRRGSSSR